MTIIIKDMKQMYTIDTSKLVGEPYEIGTGFGQALAADPGRLGRFQALVRRENDQVEALPTYTKSVVKDILALLERESPSILEWLKGMAVELSLPVQQLFLFNIGSYFRDLMIGLGSRSQGKPDQDEDGCSTFAISDSEQGPILAKNRDCDSAYGPWQVMVQVCPNRGLGYTAMTTYGVAGVNSSGMNEEGLAVADTHVMSLDIGPGLPRFAIVDKILTQCTTVNEALALVMNQPLMGRGNLILTDISGALGVAELGHRNCAVRRSGEDYMVNTNHFTDLVMQDAFLDTNPLYLQGTSLARYSRLSDLLSSGCRNLEEAQHIMAYHGTALDSLCRHKEFNPPYQTISTVFYLPQRKEALFSGGYPCIADYQKVVWK